MKNRLLMWIILLVVVVIVFISFNYQGGQDVVPLSEVFPEDQATQENIEYEYVDNETPQAAAIASTPASTPTAVMETASKASESLNSGLDGVAFTIQVLSSKDKSATEKKLQQIKDKGFDAFMLPKDLGDKGLWYRVYVGRFSAKSEAENVLNKLQTDYKNSFIISLNKAK